MQKWKDRRIDGANIEDEERKQRECLLGHVDM